MRIESLALLLQAFSLAVTGEEGRRLPGFPDSFWQWVAEVHNRYRWQRDQISDKTWQAFQVLFDDFFELRQALYDGVLIEELAAIAGPYEGWLARLNNIDAQGIDKDYLLEGRPLASVLAQVQRYIQQCELTEKMALSPQTSLVLEGLRKQKGVLLTEIPPESLEEMRMLTPDIFASLRVKVDMEIKN
jgi:hypothetical protein